MRPSCNVGSNLTLLGKIAVAIHAIDPHENFHQRSGLADGATAADLDLLVLFIYLESVECWPQLGRLQRRACL